ncbi:MAG: GNAT family N-acetyltransferase [Rhodobacteraceae bacterium]|nr:GNAT family N-acetyltransferase [Paracoccaceae bacterium]
MSWQAPTEAEILQTVDATWPAARYFDSGPFTLRLGHNCGQRVSAASARGQASAAEIGAAERSMLALDQARLFMISGKDTELDAALAARGYAIKDPVTMFACPVATLAQHDPKGLTAIRTEAPLGVMQEIWAAGRLEKGRLAVMARAKGPKTYLLGRVDDRPAGAAFVAMDGKSAMLHALEILPEHRRKGLGLAMTAATAAWAAEHGAETFSLIAVTANTAACGLYHSLGMQDVGYYHYRKKD